MANPIIWTNHSQHNPESFSADRMTYNAFEGGIAHEFAAGDVLRPTEAFTFGDSVISGFDGQGNARLLRPYLYIGVSGQGLMGYETIDRLPPSTLVFHWKKIDTGRTT